MTEQTAEELCAAQAYAFRHQAVGRPDARSYLGAIGTGATVQRNSIAITLWRTFTPLPSGKNPADLRRRTMEQLAQYIACGLDPEKNVLFIRAMCISTRARLGA